MIRFFGAKIAYDKAWIFWKCPKNIAFIQKFCRKLWFWLKNESKCRNFHSNSPKIVPFLIKKRRLYAPKSGILSQLQYRRIHPRYDKVNYMDIMGLYRPILAYNMSFMIKYRQYDKRARSNRLQIIILRLIANLFKIF